MHQDEICLFALISKHDTSFKFKLSQITGSGVELETKLFWFRKKIMEKRDIRTDELRLHIKCCNIINLRKDCVLEVWQRKSKF